MFLIKVSSPDNVTYSSNNILASGQTELWIIYNGKTLNYNTPRRTVSYKILIMTFKWKGPLVKLKWLDVQNSKFLSLILLEI